MDTLKEYIKMCDCPEIQGQWKIEIGDNYWDDEVHQIVWYEGMESKEQIKGRIEAYKTDLQPKWLPRQDQIQEMLSNVFSNREIVPLTQKLAKFTVMIIKDHHFSGRTMEQIWLALYMWEENKSIWVKDKWINQ